jgi:hypothetical protein
VDYTISTAFVVAIDKRRVRTGNFLICHALTAKQQKSEQLVELLASGALAKP